MKTPVKAPEYARLVKDISGLMEAARRGSARIVNSIITATYWEVGRRIVEFEQKGSKRAPYGTGLIERLSIDLTAKFGRGFGTVNLSQMKKFYLLWTDRQISQTVSEKSKSQIKTGQKTQIFQTASEKSSLERFSTFFPLPWSAYVSLMGVKSKLAREFYETEALGGGWSVRQIERQINSQFYERTAMARNKGAMLKSGAKSKAADVVTPDQEVKDPYVLEFLNLKDEYSESDLEDALINHLEAFLLELGGDFTFVARQKRLRIDDEWYRVDLVFFHRKLRCLVLVDLKLGKFTHADAGQMHLYLNYAAENWTHEEENPPVGVILCARKTDNVVRYALGNLPNKILAAEYKTVLPDEKTIAKELARTRKMLEKTTRKEMKEK